MGTPTKLVSLWIGGALRRLERLCLASMLEAGHEVTVFAYSPVQGLPAGVRQVDAAEILPLDDSFRERKSGSIALFSDWFRAELLRRDMGTWIDLDVFCLQQLRLPDHGYLVGYERESINGAVLHLPPQCPVLHDILEACAHPERSPAWLDPRRRWIKRAQVRLQGRSWHLSEMGWGIIGPVALTHQLRHYDLLDRVQPMKAFYPVDHAGSSKLFEAGPFEHLTSDPDVQAIHIYDKTHANSQPLPGSFMAWASGRLAHRLEGLS